VKQQTSLQTFSDPLKIMSTRPSPTESATWYMPGTYKRGNDGNLYTISVTNGGIHRWVHAATGLTKEQEIFSTKHPNYRTTVVSPPLHNYKFNVGDKVRVVRGGIGCSPDEVGKEVVIVERGEYSNDPGYRVEPPIGNSDPKSSAYRYYNGMISERAFQLVEKIKLNPKPLKMAKATKTITKRQAQDVRTIETSLINKEEVFKMLALAEATGLPCLLVGDPGVAKTKTIIEYAKAWLNKDGKMSAEDFQNKIYILETDEGTKASEIKGMPDLGKLFTENKYDLNTPIADAEIVIINEVDKASSAIRNAMLGVMNEKFLFNGKHKIPCKWKLFIATCNEIPKEEVGSPFWDRFMLKMTVNRVSAGEMAKYYEKGGRDYRERFTINVPNKAEINSVTIPTKKLEKYLEVGYQSSSDRTLTFVPGLAKAVSYIWDISVDKAGSELQNKLMSAEVKAVMSKVEMLHSHSTNEQLELAVAEIESLINAYATRGVMDQSQVEEIEVSMHYILQNHPARKDFQTSNDFEEAINEVDPTSSF
jgi:MoxR-like ATPase